LHNYSRKKLQNFNLFIVGGRWFQRRGQVPDGQGRRAAEEDRQQRQAEEPPQGLPVHTHQV